MGKTIYIKANGIRARKKGGCFQSPVRKETGEDLQAAEATPDLKPLILCHNVVCQEIKKATGDER